MDNSIAGFAGRFRPHARAPRCAAVSAPAERECWNRLLDFAGAGDKYVSAAGEHPGPPEPPPAIKRGSGQAAHRERD
jgi:hypothetical protein